MVGVVGYCGRRGGWVVTSLPKVVGKLFWQILTSWQDFTPKSKWLGGYEENGEAVHSKERQSFGRVCKHSEVEQACKRIKYFEFIFASVSGEIAFFLFRQRSLVQCKHVKMLAASKIKTRCTPVKNTF